MVDTGLTLRLVVDLERVQKYIGKERFLLTYGDGVSDINITDSIKAHEAQVVSSLLRPFNPGGRKVLGLLIYLKNDKVFSFQEKPDGDRNWVNAGYFVCEPEVFDYLPDDDDTVVFERKPLGMFGKDGQMHAYRYRGFGNQWIPCVIIQN